ncbi:MAG: hypothetical protein A3G23_14730 [Bacteroidetes bacterium RIFCSPLOWO2_12_FULL_37_12]|nr:MAG: hypothetical protein A3G23_14730 [Bacteroidetes bacterium RIFCSPLOWO2_12_FULL_37_12]
MKTKACFFVCLMQLVCISIPDFSLAQPCPVTAGFSTSDSITCSGKAVILTNTSQNSYSQNWYINGILSDSTLNFITVFPVPGVKQIMLIAYDSTCADTLVKTFQIKPSPVLTLTGDTAVQFGSSVTLNAGGADNYFWSNGLSGAQITVSPTVTSTFSVMAGNDGCVDVGYVKIIVLNSNKPFFHFSTRFYAEKAQNLNPMGLCNTALFEKISCVNPLDSVEILGECADAKNQTFSSTAPSGFRLDLDNFSLSFRESFDANRKKIIYSKGTGKIQRFNTTSSQWETALELDDLNLQFLTGCRNLLHGKMHGNITGGNASLMNEFALPGFPIVQVTAEITRFDTLQSGSFEEYAVEFDFYPVQTPSITQGASVTGTGNTLNFGPTGVSLNFDSFINSSGSDSSFATVTWFPFAPPHDGISDTLATIFNNDYWEIGSTLDSMNFEVCFTYDSTKFHTNNMDMLTITVQKKPGDPLTVLDLKPYKKSGNLICVKADHFSNWSLGVTKPDARVKIDTAYDNSGNQTEFIFSNFEESGINVGLNLPAGIIDTVLFDRFEINPGGDMPAGVKKFLGAFWEFKTSSDYCTILDISDSTVPDFSAHGNQRVLYRPDPITDWTEIPATRVRRGMKEQLRVLIDTNIRRKGQYLLAEAENSIPFFEAGVMIDTACAGTAVKFIPVLSGGVPPFTFSWSGESNFSSALQSPEHIFDVTGAYNFQLNVKDRNMGEAIYNGIVTIDCMTGIREENETPYFEAISDLSNEKQILLKYKTSNPLPVNLSVFDVMGKLVHAEKINIQGDGIQPVSPRNLPTGIYMVKIDYFSRFTIKRVIVY